MEVILYTIGCPKCKILETKLNEKKINYMICDDYADFAEKGIEKFPVLEVDGKLLDYRPAVDFVNGYKG